MGRTEKKNQHYVPRLYLKFFSSDGNSIGLFHLPNEIFIACANLKHQAKEDYFYGEDGYIEDRLSELESMAAPHLKNIISDHHLPLQSTSQYLILLTFCLVMANRTKDVVEQIDEMQEKLFSEMLSFDDSFKNRIEQYKNHSNAAEMAIVSTVNKMHLALDLKMKLLLNKTSVKFITSDHPVVKYNQFLEQRKHPGGHTGLAAKGLQIFFPISPNHMLCLYDEWVYRLGDKSKIIIELTNKEDINNLNELQILNCYEHLYFKDYVSEIYIKQLYDGAKRKRLPEYTSLNKSYSYLDKEGFERIGYHSYGHNISINLQLSFISQTKKAKRHVLSDYQVQLRDESLRNQQNI